MKRYRPTMGKNHTKVAICISRWIWSSLKHFQKNTKTNIFLIVKTGPRLRFPPMQMSSFTRCQFLTYPKLIYIKFTQCCNSYGLWGGGLGGTLGPSLEYPFDMIIHCLYHWGNLYPPCTELWFIWLPPPKLWNCAILCSIISTYRKSH